MEAMTPMPDPKDNMKKQRVIAKACVEAVQRADGNRYTFHNNWWSKEDEANRFSYYCNDSILNKGRSANGGAGTIGMLWPAATRTILTKYHDIRSKGSEARLRLQRGHRSQVLRRQAEPSGSVQACSGSQVL